jgi:hypothetical protein
LESPLFSAGIAAAEPRILARAMNKREFLEETILVCCFFVGAGWVKCEV